MGSVLKYKWINIICPNGWSSANHGFINPLGLYVVNAPIRNVANIIRGQSMFRRFYAPVFYFSSLLHLLLHCMTGHYISLYFLHIIITKENDDPQVAKKGQLLY